MRLVGRRCWNDARRQVFVDRCGIAVLITLGTFVRMSPADIPLDYGLFLNSGRRFAPAMDTLLPPRNERTNQDNLPANIDPKDKQRHSCECSVNSAIVIKIFCINSVEFTAPED